MKLIYGTGLLAVFSVTACNVVKSQGSEYVGVWEYAGSIQPGDPSPQVMEITRNGDNFLIGLPNQRSQSGSGITARYEAGMLLTGNIMAGNITYIQGDGAINFMGKRYVKR